MKIEQERGISIVTSVMKFEYRDVVFNLGHAGPRGFFRRHLSHADGGDSAVMVIDAAKGIEAQTLKLFEVCRLRDIPIITFVNKMDREARDPFALLDEIELKLAIDSAPMNWPSGWAGVSAASRSRPQAVRHVVTDRGRTPFKARFHRVDALLPDDERAELHRGRGADSRGLPAIRSDAFRDGPSDAGLFRSGIQNFGVQDLLEGLSATGARHRGSRRRQERVDNLPSRRSPASCSRSRRTWIRNTATASPSSVFARAGFRAA